MFCSTIFLRMKYLPMTYVYHREFKIRNLERPYDTMCTHPPISAIDNTWYGNMLERIDQEAIHRYKYSIPYIPTYNKSLNVPKILDWLAFYNDTMKNQVIELMNRYKNVGKNTCNINYVITRTGFVLDKRAASLSFGHRMKK